MKFADVVVQSKVPNSRLNSNVRPVRVDKNGFSLSSRLESENKSIASSLGVVLELSEEAQEALKQSSGESIANISLSDEAEEALKKMNPAYNAAGESSEGTQGSTAQTSVGEEAYAAIFSDSEQSQDIFSKDESKEIDAAPTTQTSPSGRRLTTDEAEIVQELKKRDAAVRAHENAHVAAGGGLTSSPSYSYQTGPDGKRYAIGGHVSIDTSPANTPEATVAKAERIRAAATAPADPSSADRAVAAQASQMAMQARNAIVAEKNAEAKHQARERQIEAQRKEEEQQRAAERAQASRKKQQAALKKAQNTHLFKQKDSSSGSISMFKVPNITANLGKTPTANPAYMKGSPDFRQPSGFPDLSPVKVISGISTSPVTGSVSVSPINAGQDIFTTTSNSSSVTISTNAAEDTGLTFVSTISGGTKILTPISPILNAASSVLETDVGHFNTLLSENQPHPGANSYQAVSGLIGGETTDNGKMSA